MSPLIQLLTYTTVQQLGALQLLHEVLAASFTSAFGDQSYLKQMIESRYLYSPMITTSSPLVTNGQGVSGSLLKSTSSSFICEGGGCPCTSPQTSPWNSSINLHW